MMKTYRILGKRGRVTIPYVFRQQVGFGFNDVLSFSRFRKTIPFWSDEKKSAITAEERWPLRKRMRLPHCWTSLTA